MKDRWCKKCGVTPHEQTGDAKGSDEFSCSKCFTVHYVKQICKKSPNRIHQCPTGEIVGKCQYCEKVIL